VAFAYIGIVRLVRWKNSMFGDSSGGSNYTPPVNDPTNFDGNNTNVSIDDNLDDNGGMFIEEKNFNFLYQFIDK